MLRKDRVHQHINSIAAEVLEEIKERESASFERWVPANEIKDVLELNFVSVPRANKQYGPKGWLFAIVARKLEDDGLVEYKKVGNRAFYRSRESQR